MALLSAPCYLKSFSSLEFLISTSQLLVYNGVSYRNLSLFWQHSREQMQKCVKEEVFHMPVKFCFHRRSAVAGSPFWFGNLPQNGFLQTPLSRKNEGVLFRDIQHLKGNAK